MKNELSVGKCTSQIFWGIVLHSIWLGLLSGVIVGVLVTVLNIESVIVENILTLIATAVTLFFAAKIANNGIVKKYTVNTAMLKDVVKRLWIIVIILGVVYLVLRIVMLPIALESQIQELEDANKIFGIYDIEKIRQELEAQLPETYAVLIVFSLLNIALELAAMKYAVYDLEQKSTNVQVA